MTDKERKIIERSDRREPYDKIFKKEMVKYFTKRGYKVTEGQFAFRNRGCKSPVICQFGKTEHRCYPADVIVRYNGIETAAFNEWKNNDLSLVKTFRKFNEKCPECKLHNAQSITFEEFLKEIKHYCKENGLYEEPEEEMER